MTRPIDVERLCARVADCTKSGDWASLRNLLGQLETASADLTTDRAEPLTTLHNQARRTAAILAAAGKGLEQAKLLIEKSRKRPDFVTYTQGGTAVTYGADPHHQLQHKA